MCYFIGKPFKCIPQYEFLANNTQLLEGEPSPGKLGTEDGVIENVSRPDGTKKTKNARQSAKNGSMKKSVEGGISQMAASMDKMQQTMNAKYEARREMEAFRMNIDREKFWWDKAEKMFGAGSSAPKEEREMAERLMRKRVLVNLQKIVDNEGCAVGSAERAEVRTTLQSRSAKADTAVLDTLVVANSTPDTHSSDDITVAGEASMAKRHIRSNNHLNKMARICTEKDRAELDEVDVEDNRASGVSYACAERA